MLVKATDISPGCFFESSKDPRLTSMKLTCQAAPGEQVLPKFLGVTPNIWGFPHMGDAHLLDGLSMKV
jgi:hypothetical protein